MNIFKTLKNLLCRIGRRLKVYWKHFYWTPERMHERGMGLIEEINRKRPANSVIIYAGPYMGDVCYMMAFVEEFKKQNPDKRVIVVTYSAFAKSLVETYTGFDEVALLTKRQNRLFELLSYDLEVAKFARENAVYNVQLDAAYSAEYPTVMDRLRYMFFAVGDQAPVRCHGLSPARVTSIPGFYENCNRIIVLNPYSNSGHISKKNFVYLERLAEYLTNYSNGGGFTVYTNVVKDQLPIRGTRELRCGLPEMLEIAAHIPCVISVRSGFLDFLVKTDVNMFVIYPKGGIKLQVYSMKDWKRNGIVEEVDIDDFFSDDKFERVDNFLRRIAADEKERKME